jgi:hypothetical protein
MVLILISWFLIFYCFLSFGIGFSNILKLKSENTILLVILGMVAQLIFLTTTVFFCNLGWEVFVLNFLISISLNLYFKEDFKQNWKSLSNNFKSFSFLSTLIFFIILISSAFKCAQSPFILDNESYYIQTIKWLNEYGFVKGLANLNIAFGQTSGWHILQAGFNFSFISNRFNDLNGFLLVICSFYFLTLFNENYKANNTFHWSVFILLFNVLTYQFINSPSPDLAILLIGEIIFINFLKEQLPDQEIKTTLILFLFLCFIKITIAPIGLLIFYLIYKDKKQTVFFLCSGLVFGILWVLKNTILTGFPFYSFSFLPYPCDWIVPKKLVASLNFMIQNHEFLGIPGFKNLSIVEKFKIWFGFGGINGIFNKGIVALFIVVPFLKIFRENLKFKILYFFIEIHFLSVYFLSPQFRFFLIDFVFLASIVFLEIVNYLEIKIKQVEIILLIGVILPVFIIYFIDLKNLTENKFNQKAEKLSWQQIYLPEENSKFQNLTFEKIKIGNLEFNSPKDIVFIYATSDGTLPCINKNQIEYYQKKLKIVPQLRTKNLQDGFYSKKNN